MQGISSLCLILSIVTIVGCNAPDSSREARALPDAKKATQTEETANTPLSTPQPIRGNAKEGHTCSGPLDCEEGLSCVESRCVGEAEAACLAGDDKKCFMLAASGEHNAISTLSFYDRACNLGNREACSELAHAYHDGKGTKKDLSSALTAFTKACGDSCSASQCNDCFNGGILAEDSKTAVKLFEKACDGEHAEACNSLGVRYSNGEGVEQDLERAEMLFHIACRGGSKFGCENLDDSEPEFEPDSEPEFEPDSEPEFEPDSEPEFEPDTPDTSTSDVIFENNQLSPEAATLFLKCFHWTAEYKTHRTTGNRTGNDIDATATISWKGAAFDYQTKIAIEGRGNEFKLRIKADDAIMPPYGDCGLTQWTEYEDIWTVVRRSIIDQAYKAGKSAKAVLDAFED